MTKLNHLLFFLLLVFLGGATAAEKTIVELSSEERNQFKTYLQAGFDDLKKRRSVDALNNALYAESILPENKMLKILKFTAYHQLRIFEEALIEIETVIKSQKSAPNLYFNYVEMLFVTGRWKRCSEEVDFFNQKFRKEGFSDLKNLLKFKKLLCFLALAKKKQILSKKREEYRLLAKEMVFDESIKIKDADPFYYYSRFAWYSFTKETEKTLGALRDAYFLHGSNKKIQRTWDDTLSEFGYLKKTYGRRIINQ